MKKIKETIMKKLLFLIPVITICSCTPSSDCTDEGIVYSIEQNPSNKTKYIIKAGFQSPYYYDNKTIRITIHTDREHHIGDTIYIK